MATPEDIAVNVEYIRMADECVEVPGGSNKNNYANVALIVDVAKRTKCDGVWVGWGHASENPELPDMLREAGITFLGPPSSAMRALGDKISSTIVAQTAGVPCIEWSGSGLTCPNGHDVPEDLFLKACVSLEDCRAVAMQLGFPLMVKASEGGGGKGIRMVHTEEDIEDAYLACAGEIPNSPIFLMRLATNVRHLEVQLLGDKLGNVISLMTRDCSVQRRHQKIIEEGPALKTVEGVVPSMERAAVRLAKSVGYYNAGTVEFLYHKETGKFSFLELNPRLQVEHPVTECITNVNLPAAQLAVGMGIALNRIPDIRQLYGVSPFGDEPIAFDTDPQQPAKCHTIAVRITAENPDEGFRPTSGAIHELIFRPSKTVWGYFSVTTNGGVHEFADSQFGHLFASGETREDARKAMVIALKQLTIKGEIRTTVEYITGLLELPEFKNLDVSTSWLDSLILKKIKPVPPNPYLAVVCGAVHKLTERWEYNQAQYIQFVSSGHVPSQSLLETCFTETLILNNVKYTITGTKCSPTGWVLGLNGSFLHVDTRRLRDRGMFVYFRNTTHLAYADNDPSGLRINVDGRTATFTNDVDPTRLRTTVPGKLVRFLVKDGDHIAANRPYAELEVMKMHLQLRTVIGGKITLLAVPGTTVPIGRILATVEPEDGAQFVTAEQCSTPWPTVFKDLSGQPDRKARAAAPRGEDLQTRVQKAVENIYYLVAGYDYPNECLEEHLETALDALNGLAQFGANVSLGALVLQFLPSVPSEVDQDFQSQMLYLFKFFVGKYLQMAQLFDSTPPDEVLLRQREEHKKELQRVFELFLAHSSRRMHRVLLAILVKVEDIGLMKDFAEPLGAIARLHNDRQAMVVLQARHMLSRLHAPSFHDKFQELSEKLNTAAKKKDTTILQSILLDAHYPFEMIARFFDDPNPALQCLALELHIRRSYVSTFELSNLEFRKRGHTWHASWVFRRRRHTTPSPLLEGIVGAMSSDNLESLADAAEAAEELAAAQAVAAGGASEEEAIEGSGYGGLALFNTVEELKKKFADEVLSPLLHEDGDTTNVIEVLVNATDGAGLEELFAGLVSQNRDELMELTGVLRITFLVVLKGRPPFYYTFRRKTNFEEDLIYRNVSPTHAYQMELYRLRNYELQLYPLNNPRVHVYWAREKASVRKSSERALPNFRERRFFVRVVAFPVDLRLDANDDVDPAAGEKVLVDAISCLEIARADRKFESFANHIFINCVEQPITLRSIEPLIARCYTTYAQRLFNLGVTEVEVSFRTRSPDTNALQSLRAFVRNPTIYSMSVEIFVEAHDITGAPILRPYTEPTLGQYVPPPSPTHSEYTANYANAPYPLMSVLAQKRLQAQGNNTSYVYDWPRVFEVSLRQQWQQYVARRTDLTGLQECIPTELIEAVELVPTDDESGLQPTRRPKGKNTVGMVVWRMTMYPPALFDPETKRATGREAIVVGNDITFQSGSFAISEDRVFALAAALAREKGLPLVYLAQNSGARIGVAQEIKDVFRVAFSDEDHPENGFNYIYLSEEDYTRLKKAVNCEASTDQRTGARIYRVVDVVGLKDGLGVENLRGSGLIAGEMSHSFHTIPTISLATGRSVGIGAYLNRLGRRIVQTKNSPIILTGAPALNKLLGKEVYYSNNQLGGNQIMSPNGIAHWEARDDLVGVKLICDWLDILPLHFLGTRPVERPRLQLVLDPWDRDVEFMPQPNDLTDPRLLIGGTMHKGQYLGGLFDRDSFQESLQEWAKTVVTGRARLAGIPVGVIAVETRTQEKIHPADPADTSSCAVITSQAGQVWFPDSARKTADSLLDFERERLPCFILANWRGFSGGMRDMFEEVLKFGADIVDNLRTYSQPVFVYMPPLAELRGGSWVVIDPSINREAIEMYADVTAKGGVLEPSGVIEIKYRDNDIFETMHRLDPQCVAIQSQLRRCSDAEESARLQRELKSRQETLYPTYRAIALAFAALHDTPGRMLAKECINGIVPWRDSRRFFTQRLQRRLHEFHFHRCIQQVDPSVNFDARVQLVQRFVKENAPEGTLLDDSRFVEWAQSATEKLEVFVQGIQAEAVRKQIRQLLSQNAPLVRQALLEELALVSSSQ
eukprot:TRINITY_DN3247_c0_g1_i1.p1 TRINITY_DN3247_c0_g1~~TRINITY_DN3247_c0_g1_i1.p1  ORF type:complete len:2163 (+),score=392.04 TRINITY_DN3247_c0_g1_i1:197-6490(+)